MGTASRPSASASEEKEAEEDEEGFSLVLEGSDKEITTGEGGASLSDSFVCLLIGLLWILRNVNMYFQTHRRLKVNHRKLITTCVLYQKVLRPQLNTFEVFFSTNCYLRLLCSTKQKKSCEENNRFCVLFQLVCHWAQLV